MTNFRMALLDLLSKEEQGTDPTFLRDGVRLLAQELMDADVTEAVGAAPYERTDKRVTSRNGFRERDWTPGWARSSWPSRSSARGATSRRCWNRAGAMNGRCWRWCRKPMSMA
jgi:Transposase, Mutator family